MEQCEICGQPRNDDLFSAVTGARVCSICTIKYMRGLLATSTEIDRARKILNLDDGEYLIQDNPKEAARIFGRK